MHGSWDSVNLRLLEARQSYHESVEVVDLAMGGAVNTIHELLFNVVYSPETSCNHAFIYSIFRVLIQFEPALSK